MKLYLVLLCFFKLSFGGWHDGVAGGVEDTEYNEAPRKLDDVCKAANQKLEQTCLDIQNDEGCCWEPDAGRCTNCEWGDYSEFLCNDEKGDEVLQSLDEWTERYKRYRSDGCKYLVERLGLAVCQCKINDCHNDHVYIEFGNEKYPFGDGIYLPQGESYWREVCPVTCHDCGNTEDPCHKMNQWKDGCLGTEEFANCCFDDHDGVCYFRDHGCKAGDDDGTTWDAPSPHTDNLRLSSPKAAAVTQEGEFMMNQKDFYKELGYVAIGSFSLAFVCGMIIMYGAFKLWNKAHIDNMALQENWVSMDKESQDSHKQSN